MKRPQVLVALRPNGIEPPALRDKAGHLANFHFVTGADEIGDWGADVDAAFVWNFRSTVVPDAIDTLPRLSWVHVAAVGVDASLSDQVRERELTITNSRGVTAASMAEYALALMLGHAKDLHTTLADQQQQVWRPRETRMLQGATVVLVGVGAVNRELARRATALGMNVIGVGHRARTEPIEGFTTVVTQGELMDFLGEADYVVLATPLTDSTRGMIGAPELAAMPQGAVLVNIGRGPVVQEEALMAALASGHLGGACLDVVWREPLEQEHKAWRHPNVVLSPHMSADFEGWENSMVDLFVANLQRWMNNGQLQNVVDLHLGYAPLDGASAGTSTVTAR